MGNKHNIDSQPLKLLTLAAPHECSYLPELKANSVFIDHSTQPSWPQYTQLSQAGFRRSGNHFYRPNCPDCNACKSSRVPVSQFVSSKRFNRILKKSDDLQVNIIPAEFTNERYHLFEKYIDTRHRDGDMYPPSKQQFRDFLCSLRDYSYFIEFRLAGQLIICSAIDLLGDGISAIYTYFDPEVEKRSPGVLAVLWQINYAKEMELPYVYLGYWIKDCKKMSYKDQYRPLEVFTGDNWVTLEP